MIIDSHHHLWTYSAEQYGWISDSMSVLQHDFGVAELQQLSEEASVDGFVTVQARQTVEETEWLLQLAQSESLIRGVVGWIPLASDNVTEWLDRYRQSPHLCAVRHVVQDEPDDRFLLGDSFNRGICQLKGTGLVYDILIFARHLPVTIDFVDRHPDQSFVLDHIGKPTIRDGKFDQEWADQIRELAKRENVSCKFSGVVSEIVEGAVDVDTIQPYFDVVSDAFSIKRLMYGSDWPVCLCKAAYTDWLEIVHQLTSPLTATERSDFFSGNAIRIYGLD